MMYRFNENKDYITDYIRSWKSTASFCYKRRYRKPSIKYYNIPCSFDIESTSAYDTEDNKVAWMYEWTFAFGEGLVVYGRTWKEYQELSNLLVNELQLDELQRLFIGIHNLSFEFQFMRLYFKWLEVFANGDRHPILAISEDGMEYRCTATLSGLTLAKVAENLTKHHIEKLMGDLDYKQIRCSDTPLTEEELKYCYNDVMIIIYYLEEQAEIFGSLANIVLTNTGRVRRYCRDNCLKTTDLLGKQARNWNYIEKMKELTLTKEQYFKCKAAFRGGFVHANPEYVGETCDHIGSYDLSSAYPFQMVGRKYPSGRPNECKPKSKNEFNKLLKEKCCLFKITFIKLDLIAKDSYLSWIPAKMEGINVDYSNNGRIVKADELTLYMTEVDYEIMKRVYKWEHIRVYDLTWWKRDYLPKELILCVLKLYNDKTTLKGVPDKVVEYQNSKSQLNSTYGCMVQDICKVSSIYTNDWNLNYPNMDEEIEKYNKCSSRFNYYAWGLWITAYCRLTIWKAIYKAGDDYRYSDTDSVKIANPEKYSDWFNKYNKDITKMVNDCLDHYGIDRSLASPKTIKGVSKPLGIFDFEGVYDEFKTLGAKRYMVREGDNYSITVAGCGKSAINYIKTLADNPFNAFDDELYIPAEHTGKLTHTYINEPLYMSVEDYQGNLCDVEQLSSVHLEPCSFSLSLEDDFINWMEETFAGGIYNEE